MRRLIFLLTFLSWIVLVPVQASPKPVKIMFIGDSITAGKGYCWRYHLWKKFVETDYSVDFVGDAKDQPYLGDFDMDMEGYGGKTTDQVAKSAAAGIARNQPDIACIHLGTNDFASQKQPAAEVAGEIAGIIYQLRQANPAVVIFLGKIQFVPEDYAAAVENLAAEKTTPESPVQTIDFRTGWQFEPGNDTTDYVHPNLNGVLKMTDRFFATLEPELQRRGLQSHPKPITEPLEPTNLALNKPASSDVISPGFKIKKAFDGDWKTYWAAPDQTLPHWIQVDLETPQNLTGTGILWDSAGAPYGYKIETSADAITWNTAVDHAVSPTEISVALIPQKDVFQAAGVRYLRLTVTSVPNAPWTKYPASVREFSVYGAKP